MRNQEEHRENLIFSKEDSNYVRPVVVTRYTLRKTLWFSTPLTVYLHGLLFYPVLNPLDPSAYTLIDHIISMVGLFLFSCITIGWSVWNKRESRVGMPLALALSLIQVTSIVIIGFLFFLMAGT